MTLSVCSLRTGSPYTAKKQTRRCESVENESLLTESCRSSLNDLRSVRQHPSQRPSSPPLFLFLRTTAARLLARMNSLYSHGQRQIGSLNADLETMAAAAAPSASLQGALRLAYTLAIPIRADQIIFWRISQEGSLPR